MNTKTTTDFRLPPPMRISVFEPQPEPALGQVLGLPDIRGYAFDVQIVSAPVTDGSLSSCPPAEAVTWGKVDPDKLPDSVTCYIDSTAAAPSEEPAGETAPPAGDGETATSPAEEDEQPY